MAGGVTGVDIALWDRSAGRDWMKGGNETFRRRRWAFSTISVCPFLITTTAVVDDILKLLKLTLLLSSFFSRRDRVRHRPLRVAPHDDLVGDRYDDPSLLVVCLFQGE